MHASLCHLASCQALSLSQHTQRGRRDLTSSNMEGGLTSSQSWLMDETAGCTSGAAQSWQRCFGFGESSLPDLNGFDFNWAVPTDASLKAELPTALYWGALCSKLISCSIFIFLFCLCELLDFCLVCFIFRGGWELKRRKVSSPFFSLEQQFI